MQSYILKIDVRTDGTISARYLDNNKKEFSLHLPEGEDKLHLFGDVQTVNVLVNILRDSRLRGDEEYELLGSYLYDALLKNKIGDKINSWRNDEKVDYIKIELSFFGSKNEYANWPWEYMYCKDNTHGGNAGYFVAAHPKIFVTRPVDRELEETTEPLRILLVAPGPSSSIHDDGEKVEKKYGLSLLSYQRLFATIEEIVAPYQKIIEIIKVVAEPTKNELDEQAYVLTKDMFAEKVKSIRPHVIHFFSHGRIWKNKGQLAFTDEWGRHEWVDEITFANKVKCSSNLRFVFLQACESGAPVAHKAISGVARQLVSQDVPAVVAMQCKINQYSAASFTETFYEELAKTGIIEAAVQKGRLQIAEGKPPNGTSHDERDFSFGIPVLYIKERSSLFKKEEGGRQKENIEKADRHETFFCFKCENENGNATPLKLDTKFCPHGCGAFVERPNPNCIDQKCPRKLLSWYKVCPMCGQENKEFMPK